MLQTRASARSRYDDDPSGKNKIHKNAWWRRLFWSFVALAVLAIGLPIFLSGGIPEGKTWQERVKTGLNTVKQFVLRRPDIPPADNTAAALLFATYASSASNLQAPEVADALLSAVLAGTGAGEVEYGPDMLQTGPYATGLGGDPVAMVQSLTPVVLSSLSSEPYAAVPQDIPSLLALATCRTWSTLPQAERKTAAGHAVKLADSIVARITAQGLYDIRPADAPGSADALVVRTLRQAQAIAALRCTARLLDGNSNVVNARHQGGHRRGKGLPGQDAMARAEDPNAVLWSGPGAVYLQAAEKLRLGLTRLYVKPDDEAASDGAGPFHVGLRYSSDEASDPSLATLGKLQADSLVPVRGLTSELPQLLLWLEPEDLPGSAVLRIAESSTSLATPVGVRQGQAVDASGSPDTWHTASVPWRVSPGEQAVMLAGVHKHLLFSGQQAGLAVEDDSDAWDTADALAGLVDRILRVAPALAEVQKEAAGRNDERARASQARVEKLLLQDKAKGKGKRGQDGGQAEEESSTSLLSSAHRFPFPDSLVPVASPGETPMNPRSSPPMLPVWSWLRGTSGLEGTLFRLKYLGAMVGAGAKLRVRPGKDKEAGTGDTASARAMAQQLLSSLAYPPEGLRVVRLPAPADVGEARSQRQRKQDEQQQEETRAGLQALGLASERAVGLEHVVIPVPAHAHDGRPDAPVTDSEDERGQGTLLVRGDGHPVSLPTIVAARSFRHVYEAAYAWHKARQQAAVAPSPSPAAADPHPVPGDTKGKLLARGKQAMQAAGKAVKNVQQKLKSVRLNSVLFPFAKRSSHAGPAPAIGNGALMAYLTSGDPGATAMATRFIWGDRSKARAWREQGQVDVEGGDGWGKDGPGQAAPPMPRPVPEPELDEPAPGEVAVPNSLPEPEPEQPEDVPDVGSGEDLLVQDEQAEPQEEPEGEAGPGPRWLAAKPKVDVAAVYSRLCRARTYDSNYPVPAWYESCCEPLAGQQGALALLASRGGRVAVEDLPTFSCRRGRGDDQDGQVSCAYAEDDACDCEGDAGDENTTSACAAAGGAFLCEAGVKVVRDGQLVPGPKAVPVPEGTDLFSLPRSSLAKYGYIPADKVGDGVADCVDGLDEAQGQAEPGV